MKYRNKFDLLGKKFLKDGILRGSKKTKTKTQTKKLFVLMKLHLIVFVM